MKQWAAPLSRPNRNLPEHPMADFSDLILTHVRKRNYTPLKPKALARKLGVSSPGYPEPAPGC